MIGTKAGGTIERRTEPAPARAASARRSSRTQPARLVRRLDTAASYRVLGGVLLLGVWLAIGSLGLVSPDDISSPIRAARAGWDMASSGELWVNARASLVAFVIGLAVAIAAGVPLGLAMGWNRTFRRLSEPLIVAIYVTPYLAFLPVLVVWMGIGNTVKVAVVFVAGFVPVVVNSIAGIHNVDPLLVRVGRSLDANRLQLFVRILLPASLPSVATGVRLAVGRAVLGVVAAELYVSISGIGNLISTYGQSDETDQVVFLVVLVGVFGYLVTTLTGALEKRLAGWREQGA